MTRQKFSEIDQEVEVCKMTLTLEVSPETVDRVEQARSQGANMDTLLCAALEQWYRVTEPTDSFVPRSLAPLAGKYEGEAWDELLAGIEKNRQRTILL